jgi:hypothetical protein
MSTAWCFNRSAQQWHDVYVTESDHYLGLVLMKEFYRSVNRLRAQLQEISRDELRIDIKPID